MMNLKYYWNLLRGKTSALHPAKLTFRNILAVLQAWKRKIGEFALKKHIYEQIIWRRTQVMNISPECWKSGHCVWCGCEILGKTMEDRRCDSEPVSCYPDMMNKKEWTIYKNVNNIKLFE